MKPLPQPVSAQQLLDQYGDACERAMNDWYRRLEDYVGDAVAPPRLCFGREHRFLISAARADMVRPECRGAFDALMSGIRENPDGVLNLQAAAVVGALRAWM